MKALFSGSPFRWFHRSGQCRAYSPVSGVSARGLEPLARFSRFSVGAAPLANASPRPPLFLLGVVTLLVVVFLLLPDVALAEAQKTGGGLPYETWLEKLKQSLTGPVAFILSLIGIIASGAMLIFGGDLNGFFRSMIFLVLVVALIIGASSMMTNFFGMELPQAHAVADTLLPAASAAVPVASAP